MRLPVSKSRECYWSPSRLIDSSHWLIVFASRWEIHLLGFMHTPEEVTNKALGQAKALNADCLLSLGGGSTIGLGKALGIRMNIPHIAVPTTYAGSEATPILGETVDSRKTTRNDPRILPTTIIYDVDLTLSLPQSLTYTSGINAIAHCVEALYSEQINPLIESVAVSGISTMYRSLRRLKTSPNDLDARGDAVTGAWAAGICLGHVGMAIHHKLCHTLGGTFGLPHSETHTVILPHAMAYNAIAAPGAMALITKAIGCHGSAAKALWDLEKELGTVQSLKDLGMKEEDLEKAAALACTARYPNPAPLEQEQLLKLLQNAYHGISPE
ncbi:hypothetical protein CI109_104444 [Kwoniella shandongensis]|uniref:Alcohol dehydrogenase iron-type/glycerol dehydrogenase GldA domain-containing protein n=1 Tax=Kwoniella shandongensis TaxID=1734106 RepID=A0AAJ8LML4_9TREE